MQHQAPHLVRRRLDADVLRAAAQRHRVFALIPGPHLPGEDFAGSLRRGAGLRGATDERHENERSECESADDFHGAEAHTNAVPLTLHAAFAVSRILRDSVWMTFPCL